MQLNIPLLFSVFLILAGCSSTATDKQNDQNSAGGFCLKGGQASGYSCNAQPVEAEEKPLTTAGDVDEEWMYKTLGELREWLKEEKNNLQAPDEESTQIQTEQ